jgi:putative addiction module component (TIGR02574 family)
LVSTPGTSKARRRFVSGPSPRRYDDDVAKTADDLREAVLALPSHERARIPSELLANLDSEPVEETQIDELWAAETQRRAAMLDTGDARTLTWGEIEQRFADRRAQRAA